MIKIRFMALAAMLAISGVAAADEATNAAARQTFNKNKDAVVWVTGTVKLELSGGGRSFPGRENKLNIIGTVVDPSGLTMVSYSAIDPAGALDGSTQDINGVPTVLSAKSEHSDLKITLADGTTEVPCDLVLNDPEMDLAFLLPRKESKEYKAAKFTAVKFEKGPQVQVFDTILSITRLQKAMDQTPAADLTAVKAVVTKPRTFIIPNRLDSPGSPVFTPEGVVVGFTTFRIVDRARMQGAVVIIPAGDAAKMIKQALAAKPPTTATTKAATTKATTQPNP